MADSRPSLTAPRGTVRAEIEEQHRKGEELSSRTIRSEAELKVAEEDYRVWSDYNKELLRQRFTSKEVAEEYARPSPFVITGNETISSYIQRHKTGVKSRLTELASINARLDLYEAPSESETAEHAKRPTPSPDGSVFIIHGHDDGLKEAVARQVQQLTGREPIILHEQPNRGRTVIEKLEQEGASASYAVALLTGDDAGQVAGSVGTDDPQPRARQNVVFEAGYFTGALGRSNVAILHEENVELPPDLSGVVYIIIDSAGAWRTLLARELKAAGLPVDADALLT
jgi:predicted nucleotide-binding protein